MTVEPQEELRQIGARKITTATETCQECNSETSKYTCPRCQIRTCSARCVRHHKERIGCSGERDRATFISKTEFREEDLLSDYNLLEELGRRVEELAKEDAAAAKKKWNNQNGALKYKYKPELNALRNWCRRCGSTRLLFLPDDFQRRRENTTKLDRDRGVVEWKVRLVFPQAAGGERDVQLDCVDDTTRIHDLFRPYVDPEGEGDLEDPFLPYRSAGIGRVKILLKAEHELPSHKEGKTFHELDSRRSLRWNIRRRTIVEHPVLYAVLDHHSHYFVYEEPCESRDFAMSSDDEHSAVDSRKRKLEGGNNDDYDDVDDNGGAASSSFGLLAPKEAEESDEDSVTAGERKRRARAEEAAARSRREGEEVERRWMAGHQRRWRGARREFDDNQLVNRFVTDGDESNSRDAEAGQQEAVAGGENAAAAPTADPNLYQKCYDYYAKFYRAKYGVVDEAAAAPAENKDSNASEKKSSAALSALGGYGTDSDSDSPENE